VSPDEGAYGGRTSRRGGGIAYRDGGRNKEGGSSLEKTPEVKEEIP